MFEFYSSLPAHGGSASRGSRVLEVDILYIMGFECSLLPNLILMYELLIDVDALRQHHITIILLDTETKMDLNENGVIVANWK